MVKAHPFLYIPKAYVGTNAAGYYATGIYAKPAKALYDAVSYVLTNISKEVVFRNPNMTSNGIESYNTIYYSDGDGYDSSVVNLLAKYKERPVLLFVDFDNGSLAGVLTGSEVTFDNIVDMYQLFTKADYNQDAGVYEIETPDGKKIPFVFDSENGHLVLQDENGSLVPRHSLLDLIYVGANLGLLDRPYLRDWFSKVLRGYKDELIDFGILALTAAGTGTAIVSKNKKVKIGGAGVAAVSGAIFGYRVISRNKKKKEAAAQATASK